MPLARYFFFVGAALLALLFISDAYLPRPPVMDRADADLPVIRINSDRKWPEPVVFDTSHPSIVAMPVISASADTPTPLPATDTGRLGKARILDAFAQLQTPDLKTPAIKKPDAKLEARPQPKRKVAKKQLGPPIVLVAQHPQFGFFASNTW